MALVFKLGTMGSAKTLNLLAKRHDYQNKGHKIAVVVPSVDKRYGLGVIKSRSGLHCNADVILDTDEELGIQFKVNPDLILADEAQFFSPKTIESFRTFTDSWDVDVICYGIRTDFKSRLFPGSRRLLELADKIEHLHTLCYYCKNTATFNLRIDTFRQEQVVLGDSDMYKEVCSQCYYEERGGFE